MKRYLNEFVTEKNYIDYFLNIIKDYIYTGDFYSLNTTIEMINSSKYSNAIKNHLIDFVTEINKYDLKSVSSHTSRNTILSYTQKLSAIGVNPITTIKAEYIEGLYSRLLKKYEDYFNSERWYKDE